MSKLPVPVGAKSIDKPGQPATHAVVAAGAAAPLAHAVTTQRLTQKQAVHAAQNGALSMMLMTRFWDPTVWSEWTQLQAAVWQRLQKQNQDWRQGCEILVQDYAQLKQANTMSKLLEKQCNLMTQSAQLLTNQSTNFVALLENIDVDYGYWASQKLAS
jgi:hypothetical protein